MAKAKSSATVKKKSASDADDASSADISFEQALQELETLVESMESDQAPLDELIENYEKGTRLYDLCQQRLENAQRRVDLIREGAASDKKKLQPFDAESESLERNTQSQANTKTDDGQLF
ncbi:MAG: exodeoxyribonuclease VII small subunit [Verrucomicrobia bacterium]|nr:exodeoxyribonuclease VII small subunit [Verrucomicrobiota bacterium]